jgi:DNA-binding Lrp family transcriptional regulator
MNFDIVVNFNISRPLTKLEEELFEKLNFIQKKFNMTPKYLPKRVEPGKELLLKKEENWSKFAGETLFINRGLLDESWIENAIMWREAFLLLVPLEMRNYWWVHELANVFFLSVKNKKMEYEKWKTFLIENSSFTRDIILKYELGISIKGSQGLLRALQDAFDQQIKIEQETNKLRINKTISRKEFNLVLFGNLPQISKINESTLQILTLALKHQTTSIKELEDYADYHPTTISQTLNQLKKQKTLFERPRISYHKLQLSNIIVLFFCNSRQGLFFKHHHPKSPYLHSQKINHLNIPIITQYYIAPDFKSFQQELENHCKRLMEENYINQYYIFNISKSYTSYNFNHYDCNNQQFTVDLNDLFLENNYFRDIDSLSYWKTLEPGNLIINHIADIKNPECSVKINPLDLKILNLFLKGITSRRKIQNALKKSMNTIVNRIKKLEQAGFFKNQLTAIFPNAIGQITLYLDSEEIIHHSDSSTIDQSKLKQYVEIIKNMVYQFPYANISEIEGTFKGFFIHLYLPYKYIIQLCNRINWFLPDCIRKIMVVGRPLTQKYQFQLPVECWQKNQWITKASDFNYIDCTTELHY